MKIFTLLFYTFFKLLLAYNINQHPNWHLIDHTHCGDSPTNRIIGGEEASLGQFPWMACLFYKITLLTLNTTTFACGGSLINNLYVVTAAHCILPMQEVILDFIRLGEHNIDTKIDCENDVCAPPVQDFRPVKLYRHKDFYFPSLKNDIALIRLDRLVQFSDYILPICLPQGPLLSKSYVGSKVEVAGWGVKNVKTEELSSTLLHVWTSIVDPEQCQITFGKDITLSKGQLCAGGVPGYDSCAADSGGPLMKAEAVDGPPRYYLIGVVSLGRENCGSKYPAIYSDIIYYLTWILDNIEPL